MGEDFVGGWTAELLKEAPMIAPARVYVWPMRIAGEEDALARGALHVLVRPAAGGRFLLQCALGFSDPAMPSGVWECPAEGDVCVVAGGYAYVGSVGAPERCVLLGLKPVVQVVEAPGLLLFVGFQKMMAWGAGGLAWETGRLSWEGVRVTGVSEGELRGVGWDLMADEEREFVVDLKTGLHAGGGYRLE